MPWAAAVPVMRVRIAPRTGLRAVRLCHRLATAALMASIEPRQPPMNRRSGPVSSGPGPGTRIMGA